MALLADVVKLEMICFATLAAFFLRWTGRHHEQLSWAPCMQGETESQLKALDKEYSATIKQYQASRDKLFKRR